MDSGATVAWDRIPVPRRRRVIWTLWFITWAGLLAGLYDREYFEFVVLFSAIHALLFLVLFGFNLEPFPVQVRIAYLVWVAVGTYVPYMTFLMYITVIGLAANLFLGYCPLARLVCLLPWNREERFSPGLVYRVFFSPPVKGQFKPPLASE